MKPRLDILHSEPQSAKCPVGNDLSVSWLLHVEVAHPEHQSSLRLCLSLLTCPSDWGPRLRRRCSRSSLVKSHGVWWVWGSVALQVSEFFWLLALELGFGDSTCWRPGLQCFILAGIQTQDLC